MSLIGTGLIIWSVITLLISVMCGGIQNLAILATLFLLTYRRPKNLFFFLLLILPLFGNSPGRIFVHFFNPICALIILQWLLFQKHIFSLTYRQKMFLFIAGTWLLISGFQLAPLLYNLMTKAQIDDFSTILSETFLLDETSHLFPIQLFFHRSWAIIMVLFLFAVIKQKDLVPIIRSLLIGLSLTVAVGLVEYFHIFPVYFIFPKHSYGEIQRLQSLFGNPGWLAEYLCLMLPVVGILLFHPSRSRQERIAAVLLVFWSSVTLFLTYARAGWITYSIIFLTFFIFWGQNQFCGRVSRKRILLIVCIGICLGVSLFYLLRGPIQRSTFLNKEEKFGTNFSRLQLWNASYSLWKKYPVVGNGIGTFWDKSTDFLQDGSYLALVQHNTAHNTFFHLLADEGLAGCLFFVLLFVRAGLRIIGKKIEPEMPWYIKASFVSLWLCIFVYGMFQHLFYIHAIELLIWFIMAVPEHSFFGGNQAAEPTKSITGSVRFLAVAVLLISCIFIIFRGNVYPLSYGFYKYEGWKAKLEAHFRWTKSRTVLYYPSVPQSVSFFCLPVLCNNPDINQKPLKVDLTINQTDRRELTFTSSVPDFIIIPLDNYPQNTLTIKLQCSRTWQPVAFGVSRDDRSLGLATGPPHFLSWKDAIAKNIDEKRWLMNTQKNQIKPFVTYNLVANEDLYFPGYPGLRFLLIDIENKDEYFRLLELSNPSGNHELINIIHGRNRLRIQIPPAIDESSMHFKIMSSNSKVINSIHEQNIMVQYLEWYVFPWQIVKHFAYQ